MRRPRLDAWDGIAVLGFLLLGAFLVVPLGRLLWASVVAEGGGLTLRHYAQFLGRPYYSRTIGHSFLVASLVTVASLIVALPLAGIVGRVRISGAPLLRTLAILPLVSPPFIGAYSWILLFGRAGYVTATLRGWGISLPTVYGMHGIVLALALNLYPLVFLIVLSGMRAVDHSLEEAAQGLGSPRRRVAWTVTLPLLLPSVAAGALLVFLTAFADFGAPMIIGEGYQVLPTVVYSLFVDEMGGPPALASTAATVLVLCTTVLLLLMWWLTGARSFSTSQLRPTPLARPRPLVRAGLTGFAYLTVGLSLVPAVVVGITSFFETRGPVLYPHFSLGSYREVLFNVPRALVNSVALSGLSTLLDVALGTLIAYLAVRRPSVLTRALDSAVMLPYAVPGTVVGIAYIVAFNAPPLVLTGTFVILVLAYAVRRLPYAVRSGAALLHQLDPAVEEASVSLGVPPVRTFFRLTARLMLPGIVSGAILTWVQTITEISATVFLYTAAWSTVTVVIYRQVSSSNFGAAAAASTLLLAAVFIPVMLVNWMMGERLAAGV